MKAVVLAAGEGKRMRPLTLKTPKPLLKISGKPIIDYVLESLSGEIDEVVIVVGYLGNQIKNYIGPKNRHMKVKYVTGSNKGSAYSLIAAKKHLKNQRFLVVQGDEIPHPRDIKNCLAKNFSVLVFESKNPSAHGIGYLSKDGSLAKIIEKPQKPKSNLGVNGVMVLNSDIFNYQPQLMRGEYYLSTMVGRFVLDHKVYPVEAEGSIGDITAPSDLNRAGKILQARL